MWCHLRAIFLASLLAAMTSTASLHASKDDDYDGKEECYENADCATGHFCYTETHRCAKCVDCASRFRLNGSWGCHHEASECGDCIPGYTEIGLERNTKKESCMPVVPGLITTSKTSSSGTENMMTNGVSTLGIMVGLSVVIIVSITLAATFLYRWRKGRRTPLVQQSATELQELVPPTDQHNPPPPPYSPFAYKSPTTLDPTPTAPFDATVQVNSPRDCDTNITVQTHPPSFVPGVEREHLVRAAFDRCNHPNWVNARDYVGDQSPPTSPPQSPPQSPPPSDASTEGSVVDIQDDTTQPSDWTPARKKIRGMRKHKIGNTSRNTSQEDVEESVNQQAAPEDHPPAYVGSTAVGTVPEITSRRNSQDLSWRENGDEDQASGQEPNENEGPKQKKMRSESPPPPTRNFPPGVFVAQQNSNANQFTVNNIHQIQINLSVNREDHNSDTPASSPNMLLDSEDLIS